MATTFLPNLIDVQGEVNNWVLKTFQSPDYLTNKKERQYRLFEESVELMQSCGMTREEMVRVIDQVLEKPVNPDIAQEVGGVFTTLAAFCTGYELDLYDVYVTERKHRHDNVDRIRAKQEQKKVRAL